MTTKQQVAKVLKMIKAAYPAQIEVTPDTIGMWHLLLKDLDADVVMAATVEVCADGDRFPPPAGVVRQRALRIASGSLSTKTGGDAWDRVLKFCAAPIPDGMSGNELASQMLTLEERLALKSIGGSWEIAHCKNGDFLRSQFIKRFDELQAAEKAEANATPETQQLVESRQDVSGLVKQLAEKMGE